MKQIKTNESLEGGMGNLERTDIFNSVYVRIFRRHTQLCF